MKLPDPHSALLAAFAAQAVKSRFILPVVPGKLQIVGDEISVQQFARLARLSEPRIRQLCDEGKLNFRRLNPNSQTGKIVIPTAELDRFLQQ